MKEIEKATPEFGFKTIFREIKFGHSFVLFKIGFDFYDCSIFSNFQKKNNNFWKKVSSKKH